MGDSRHTFHSHDNPSLSGTQRWHFLCYCTLLLSKNCVFVCLILTSNLSFPSPFDMPKWLPRKLALRAVIADNNSMYHLLFTFLVPVSVLSFLCGFSLLTLPQNIKKMVLLSPPHGWEYYHHIFFSILCLLCFKISPHGVRDHYLEGTHILLEVKLNTDTIALSSKLPSDAKLLPFVYNYPTSCLFIAASELVHRQGCWDYLDSHNTADTE